VLDDLVESMMMHRVN